MVARTGIGLASGFLVVAAVLFQCSNIEYNNPIDINGSNEQWLREHPDALLDKNNNGIADYWDIAEYWKDTTKPVINVIGGDTVTIVEGDAANLIEELITQISYSDPHGGPLTPLPVEHNIDIFVPNMDAAEPYHMIYFVEDTSGNIGTATRYIRVRPNDVVDTIKPVIWISDTLIYIYQGTTYIDEGVSAWDVVDKDLTSRIITSGTVETSIPGPYVLTYTVTDASGNTAERTRTVVVQPLEQVDTVKPQITLIGEDTLVIPGGVSVTEYFASYVDSGYRAWDNHDLDITEKVIVSAPQSLNGTYWFISYDVTDSAGNHAPTQRRYFDTGLPPATPPWIELAFADSTFQITVGGAWTEPGYEAFDLLDGNIKDRVIVDSSELINNRENLGSYGIIYSVTNNAGISVSEVRTVHVVESLYDTVKPVITLSGKNPDSVEINSYATYPEPGYIAVDNRDDTITSKVDISGEVHMDSIGKYTLHYSVADNATNIGRATRTVWVVRDLNAGTLLATYGVPSENSLPTLEGKTFSGYSLDGEAPDLSVILSMTISWNATNGQIYDFALQLSASPYHKPITSMATHTFGSPYPTLSLNGTGIAGLDGEYYVVVDGDEFIWVEQSGDFAIIWHP